MSTMVKAVGRKKVAGGENRPWYEITHMNQPFFGDEGIMQYAIERMAIKYPEIEYKLMPAPEAEEFAKRGAGFNFSFGV